MAHPAPPDWPFRDRARSVAAAGHDWWVIDTAGGAGDTRPVILMLHGAGGSGHSFRHLIPGLSNYRLIVPDLPGQGLTRTRGGARFSLEAMTRDLATLCKVMDAAPSVIIGHSAGAAIALNLARQLPVQAVVGINAALGKFEGVSGVLFPAMARVLAALPLVPQAASLFLGNAASVDRLLASTGSAIEPEGRAQYLALVRRADHVNGTLGMMAAWQLDALNAALPDLATPTLLIAAKDDQAVPARVSQDAVASLPHGRLCLMTQGGHLVHEVDADAVLTAVLAFLGETALQPSA